MNACENSIKGNIVKGLLKETYAKYQGTFHDNENETYLTTDRYLEKYVLLTNVGLYEIWAGGYRLKENMDMSTFSRDERFDALAGLIIAVAEYQPERLLKLYFSDVAYLKLAYWQNTIAIIIRNGI